MLQVVLIQLPEVMQGKHYMDRHSLQWSGLLYLAAVMSFCSPEKKAQR